MRKTRIMFAVVLGCLIVLLVFAGCGSGGGDKSSAKKDYFFQPKIKEDYGYLALFEIKLDFSHLPSGKKFVQGQSAPDSVWIDYEVFKPGLIYVVWPKGDYFEFSYGTEDQEGKKTWIEPSGNYAYPPDTPSSERRFRLKLGEAQICPQKNLEDTLVVAIIPKGSGQWRIYLDFTKLPVKNYQKFFVRGQSAPDLTWKEYPVYDEHPCYSFEVNWPDTSWPFEFSFGVIKEDGNEEWINPSSSKFFYRDHLAIKFN